MSTALDQFFSAWSVADAGARADLIAAAMAPVFSYADVRSEGRLATLPLLNAYVGQFPQMAPGWTATVADRKEVAGYTEALVAFSGPDEDGTPVTQYGTYFADLDAEGRLATLVGFSGNGLT